MEREFKNGQLYLQEDNFHTESSCFKPNSTGVRGHVSVLVIQMADITLTNKIVLPWVPKVFFRARG